MSVRCWGGREEEKWEAFLPKRDHNLVVKIFLYFLKIFFKDIWLNYGTMLISYEIGGKYISVSSGSNRHANIKCSTGDE